MKKINKLKNFFDKLFRNCLQYNLIDKNEYESLCKICSKSLDEKNEPFYKYEQKNKTKLFE